MLKHNNLSEERRLAYSFTDFLTGCRHGESVAIEGIVRYHEAMEDIPEDICADLKEACRLHERAACDYEQCVEFSRIMTGILARLETAHCWDMADRVMAVLLDCNPKAGVHCDKAAVVEQALKKLEVKL